MTHTCFQIVQFPSHLTFSYLFKLISYFYGMGLAVPVEHSLSEHPIHRGTRYIHTTQCSQEGLTTFPELGVALVGRRCFLSQLGKWEGKKEYAPLHLN